MHAAGVHHQHEEIDSFKRGGHFLHHLPTERGIRFVHAGSINENDLAFRFRQDALDAVARRLRFGSDDGNFLSDQPIYERGFPRVWPPENRDEARTKHFSFLVFRVSHQGFTIGNSSALEWSASCTSAMCAFRASFPVSAATTPPLL